MPNQQFVVVERFKDVREIYRRLAERGRMTPEGLIYVSSWIDEKPELCFQLMEAPHRSLLDQWIANRSDVMDFDIYPVITSQEAAERARQLTRRR